jgi:hypothetical protein
MRGCQRQFWSILTVVALLWTCGCPILSVAQYLSHTPKTDSSASVVYGVLNFLWIGLPVTGICAFFSYRNSCSWRKQNRYKEMHEARERRPEVQHPRVITRPAAIERRQEIAMKNAYEDGYNAGREDR